MPTFTREVEYDDYRTDAYIEINGHDTEVPVTVSVCWDENIDIDTDDYVDECTTGDLTDLLYRIAAGDNFLHVFNDLDKDDVGRYKAAIAEYEESQGEVDPVAPHPHPAPTPSVPTPPAPSPQRSAPLTDEDLDELLSQPNAILGLSTKTLSTLRQVLMPDVVTMLQCLSTESPPTQDFITELQEMTAC